MRYNPDAVKDAKIREEARAAYDMLRAKLSANDQSIVYWYDGEDREFGSSEYLRVRLHDDLVVAFTQDEGPQYVVPDDASLPRRIDLAGLFSAFDIELDSEEFEYIAYSSRLDNAPLLRHVLAFTALPESMYEFMHEYYHYQRYKRMSPQAFKSRAAVASKSHIGYAASDIEFDAWYQGEMSKVDDETDLLARIDPRALLSALSSIDAFVKFVVSKSNLGMWHIEPDLQGNRPPNYKRTMKRLVGDYERLKHKYAGLTVPPPVSLTRKKRPYEK